MKSSRRFIEISPAFLKILPHLCVPKPYDLAVIRIFIPIRLHIFSFLVLFYASSSVLCKELVTNSFDFPSFRFLYWRSAVFSTSRLPLYFLQIAG